MSSRPRRTGGLTEVKMTKEIRQMKESPVSGRERDGNASDAELVRLAVTRVKEGDNVALHWRNLGRGADVA